MSDDGEAVGPARYDRFAEWYAAWVTDVPAVLFTEGELVPSRLSGQRWLDVACGAGRASRQLARRGASVVGVDLSERLLHKAKGVERAEPMGIRYVFGDVSRPAQWWDGVPFDGAVCEMALMDIDGLDSAVAGVAEVVAEDAPFLASLVHPCFGGNEMGLSSWPPHDSYFFEGWWTSTDHNVDGVRIRVGSNHRTLSRYVNALINVGLCVERLIEPPGPTPTLLVIACRRVFR